MRASVVLGVLALTLLPSSGTTASRSVTFEDTWARAQDPQTMEKGLLRSDLRTLRGIRDRSAVYLVAAPAARWEREVAPRLLEALDADPASFESVLAKLPSDLPRSGPGVEGGQLKLSLSGGGDGLVTVHMPALLSAEPSGAKLLNAHDPNKAHFLAGFQLTVGGPTVAAMHVPRGLRPLSRGMPPRVPLVDVAQGQSWAALGDDEASGDAARDLRKELSRMATLPKVSVPSLRPTPRRSAALTDWLRSVRLSGPALATPEGPYRTLTQAPSGWATETRTVRHPSRYVALAAPVAAVGDDGGTASMVLGVVAFYTPLLLTLEEAPLLVGADPLEFAKAVHSGEVPFFADGGEALFYRPWVERWAKGKGAKPGGKESSVADAREQVSAWGDKHKLPGLTRAAKGPIPVRLATVPASEREGLIDSAQVAWGRVWSEDLTAWLKHLEPGLKPGKQAPLWAFAPRAGGELLEATFALSTGAMAAAPSYLSGMGTRGGGGGGGAETLHGTAGESMGGGGASDLSVEVLDMFSSDAFCPLGRRAVAGLEFALDGVAEGRPVPLQVEWDLRMGGRSVRMDSFTVRREAGTHEVDFELTCPDRAGDARLEVVLVDPGGNIAAEGTLELDARAYGGRSWGALSMPSPKSCLAFGGGGGDGEFSVATTQGLSGAQVQSAVRGFQEQTLRCYDAGGGNGTVQLELLVGCDGVVMSSEVVAETTGDVDFAECVADTFRYAPFPAHDREGGALFEVPLRYD